MPALSHDSTPFFRRGPSPFARFVFFGLLSLAILFTDTRYGYLESIRTVVAMVLAPLQRAALLPVQAWDGVEAYFATQTRLSGENTQLKQQLLTEGVLAQSAQSLAQENARLRGLLKAQTRSGGTDILAEVLYLGRDPFSQKVFVNKGTNDLVRAGQAVVDDVGVVGQVTRALPAVSEVTLLTEKDHTIPVKLERNGIRTLLVGAGTGRPPELRFMSASADVQPGDVLVTSGLDGTYPPGLAVAVIASVERDSGLMFARIACRPLAGVDRSDQVLIVPAPATGAPPRPEEQAEAETPKRGSKVRRR
ncbi:MAG: rod shape-determining protein MreC [Betaproteobacteria bacterium]